MPWKFDQPDVSLVVPVYRTAGNMEPLLAAFETYIESSILGFQLVIVDDGSVAAISEQLFAFAAERDSVTLIRHEENMGKGRSIADGVAVAIAPMVVFADSEMSYDMSIIETMHRSFKENPRAHFLVGSRRHPDSDIKNNYNIPRRIFSWGYNLLASAVVVMPITDVQCGIKAFRRDAARLLFSDLVVSRFAFDAEIFLRAKKYSLTFLELPVTYRRMRLSPHPTIQTTISMLSDLRRLYGAYRKNRS
ncbi:MAG: dolichyl-phosphate beta-glucosyltransferase [Patescibacteria group bacterium]|jgi:glycosyltransferase involved in cell wall biosynthesis|nr:dolichyl-phosphate beta-glucosyltransferase [Patescibacteria group bacterium]